MVDATRYSRQASHTWDAEARRHEAQVALARARTYLREGKTERAEAALNRALLLDPASVEAVSVRAILTYQRGDLVEAERRTRQAITLVPADGALRRTLGSILEDLGREQEAANEYALALALDPHDAMANAARGGVLLRQGMLGEAEEHLRQALQVEPQDPVTLADLAEARQGRGDRHAAIDHLRAALALLDAPAAPPLLRHRAMPGTVKAREARGMYQQRLDHLLAIVSPAEIPRPEPQGVLSHAPGPSEPMVVEQRAGQNPGLNVQVAPAASMLQTGHGRADGMGVPADPIAALEERVRALPDDRRLRRELSTAYLRAGRLAEAREQLQRAEQLLGRRGLNAAPR